MGSQMCALHEGKENLQSTYPKNGIIQFASGN